MDVKVFSSMFREKKEDRVHSILLLLSLIWNMRNQIIHHGIKPKSEQLIKEYLGMSSYLKIIKQYSERLRTSVART